MSEVDRGLTHRGLSARDLEAIERSVEARDIHLWAPLTSAERDLVRRALAPVEAPQIVPQPRIATK